MKATCRDLGRMDYEACWQLQQSLFEDLLARKTAAAKHRTASTAAADAGKVGTVLLVEHPPVYTLGKSGHAENLLVTREALETLGARFFHIDRGGDITFHGPGQLVCYPILDLERIGLGLRDYVDALEEAVIRTAARYGITAGRIAGASGVWVGGAAAQAPSGVAGSGTTAWNSEGSQAAGAAHMPGCEKNASHEGWPRKICAIGVRASRYVTMHGFALNVSTDLGWFARINPCGFTDRDVTSMERETGRKIAMEQVKRDIVRFLSESLGICMGTDPDGR